MAVTISSSCYGKFQFPASDDIWEKLEPNARAINNRRSDFMSSFTSVVTINHHYGVWLLRLSPVKQTVTTVFICSSSSCIQTRHFSSMDTCLLTSLSIDLWFSSFNWLFGTQLIWKPKQIVYIYWMCRFWLSRRRALISIDTVLRYMMADRHALLHAFSR